MLFRSSTVWFREQDHGVWMREVAAELDDWDLVCIGDCSEQQTCARGCGAIHGTRRQQQLAPTGAVGFGVPRQTGMIAGPGQSLPDEAAFQRWFGCFRGYFSGA